jgi:hypothetical protein
LILRTVNTSGEGQIVHRVVRRIVALSAVAVATATAQLRAGEVPADNPSPQAATETPQPTSSTGEAWRFRRHDGLWWYWLPSERWVYWHEGQWVDYDAKKYAEWRAQRSQTSRATRGGDGYWGQWGPIRYDRFGNPQYPYSQRRSGMRQLGPVPTPGGVRSLPGWGGER